MSVNRCNVWQDGRQFLCATTNTRGISGRRLFEMPMDATLLLVLIAVKSVFLLNKAMSLLNVSTFIHKPAAALSALYGLRHACV